MYQGCEQAVDRVRAVGATGTLRENRIGLEKESLRIDLEGHIAQTPHPVALGSALTHPYITTDFSEALLEFVTPPFVDTAETLRFLGDIHQFTYRHLDDELLWCASMPCMVGGDESIPIANYGRSNVGTMKRIYRRGLSYRYGRTMQTIAGIHFNLSLPIAFWKALDPELSDFALRRRIDDAYFGAVRNFLRYGWLVPYLLGSSPAVCKSFLPTHAPGFSEFDKGSYYLPHGTSARMSDVGYHNTAQQLLHVDYDGVQRYAESLNRAIETVHPAYADIGVKVDGEYRQLNANVLQIENEFYSTIRPKRITRSGEKPSLALARRGVQYLEVRALDVNPFEPLGVSDPTLRFLEALVVLCVLQPSAHIDSTERECIQRNHSVVASEGRRPDLKLDIGGRRATVQDHARALLDAMAPVCALLDDAHGFDATYGAALDEQAQAVAEPERLPSARVLDTMRREGVPFFRLAMNLSERHRDYFRDQALSADKRAMFEQEAARSLAQQREVEAANSIDFEEYLRRYFAQTLGARERLLG